MVEPPWQPADTTGSTISHVMLLIPKKHYLYRQLPSNLDYKHIMQYMRYTYNAILDTGRHRHTSAKSTFISICQNSRSNC